ncbi:MAG: hypothetical protein AAFR16_03800 [Pseudomonadota bacterium]
MTALLSVLSSGAVTALLLGFLSSDSLSMLLKLTLLISVGAFLSILESRHLSLLAAVQRSPAQLGLCAVYALATALLISSLILSALAAVS